VAAAKNIKNVTGSELNDEEDFPETPAAEASPDRPEGQTDTRDLTSISDLSKQRLSAPSASSLTNDTSSNSLTQPSAEDLEDFAPIESSGFQEASRVLDNSAILVAPPELAPTPPVADRSLNSDVINTIREYSEQLSNVKEGVPAAFPFSLLITGELNADEKDKLGDILSREKMGISKVDLETQFDGNHILIPRISEFAGVLLVQALRDTNAVLRLAPADEVFSTEATLTSTDEKMAAAADEKQNITFRTGSKHPAEGLPITTGDTLPEVDGFCVIDVLTASAALRTTLVEAQGSAEYQETLEALQRELRYKAYYKQAIGILNFSAQLTTLQLPSQYRLTVAGTAVRKLAQ